MVPNDWERKPIKDLCESIIDCVNKTAKHVEHVTPFKMIRTTNVRNGRVDTSNVRYVEEDTYKQWIRRGAPKDGDIIFTREAPVGEAGILENAQGIFLGQRTMMYRSHPKRSDNRYLFYSLMSGYCQKQIEDFSNGGTVAHMRVPDCGELIINTPPLPEQRKIAKILSTWDKAIATTEKLIETSKQQKKALMQQLLTGKKRLVNPETGKEFEGEWEEVKLGDISYITTGSSNREDSSLDAKYTFFDRSEDIRTSSRYLFDAEAVIVAGEGQDFVPKHFEGKFDLHQRTYAIMNFENSFGRFLYYYIGYYRHYFLTQAVGSTVKSLRLPMFKKMPIKLPTMAEQQKIASVLTVTDKEIELLEAKLAHFKQEKKALMQQLLTGKRRVKVDEMEVV